MLERQQNLKRLTLETTQLKDYAYEVIARNCKNLEFLKISYSQIVLHRGETNILIQNELILKHMVIKELKFDDRIYFPSSFIQACKQLVSLDMEGKLFQFICRYMHVFIIFLHKYKTLFRPIGFRIKKDNMQIIGNLEKLEKLNLSGTRIRDRALRYIHDLKELACRDCKSLTKSGLKQFIESSPKLELLDIRGCKNIKEPYIRKIAEATCNSRSNNVPLEVLV